MRKIVLDTETTGFASAPEIAKGHYVIEIGAIEIYNRSLGKRFHRYVRAPIPSTPQAFAVHGLTEAFLKDFSPFSEICDDFLDFIQAAELIIHNAPFDLAFLNQELSRLDSKNRPSSIENHIGQVTDTLVMARKAFPNRKNNLDVLCQRFKISTAHRVKHGALLDSELLAEVYLALTAGQCTFAFTDPSPIQSGFLTQTTEEKLSPHAQSVASKHLVFQISPEEKRLHEDCLKKISDLTKAPTLWETRFTP